jgi:hypothetical protein
MAACRIREFGVWRRSAGAYLPCHVATATHHVGRMPCLRAAVLVVLPYLLGDCATPGGGTNRRLTLRRRLCLYLTIASMLLGAVLGLIGPLGTAVKRPRRPLCLPTMER